MRREAAGRVATAAMTGAAIALAPASAKAVKREDDDDDVGVTQGGPHLAVSDGAARGRRAGAGGWLSGPMGRKRPWAEREVGGPLCTVTFPIFPLG
jgi:hypothetical protein